MKKINTPKVLSALMCAALLIVMTSCPYSSTVPLDDPSVKVSGKILGKWVEQSEFDENPDYYVFLKKNDNRYTLEEYAYEEDEEEGTKGYVKRDTYSGHITKLGDKDFFNLFKADENTYYFYWLEFPTDTEFIMHEVTDNIMEEFTSSTELKAFFVKHKDLSFFYNRDAKRYMK